MYIYIYIYIYIYPTAQTYDDYSSICMSYMYIHSYIYTYPVCTFLGKSPTAEAGDVHSTL